MRNAIAIFIVLLLGATAWGEQITLCKTNHGTGKVTMITVGTPAEANAHIRAGFSICGDTNLPGGNSIVMADVSELLVINSASAKVSNSLVELVDNSDANVSSPLGLE